MDRLKAIITKIISITIFLSLSFTIFGISDISGKMKNSVEKSQKLTADAEESEKTEDEREGNSLAALLENKMLNHAKLKILNFSQNSSILPLAINNAPFQPPRKLS